MGNESTEICSEKAAMQNFTDICSLTAAIDYTRTEPCIIWETAHWTVVYKPPHLPTAPLRAEEHNTLVYWFLHSAEASSEVNGRFGNAKGTTPEPPAEYGKPVQEMQADTQPETQADHQLNTQTAVRIQEAQVCGKKAIEAGLLHRLDTDTRGLVLFAKDQATYDFLAARQEAGQMIKTYCAFVEPCTAADDWCYISGNTCRSNIAGLSAAKNIPTAVDRIAAQLPYSLVSQFRNFGPGAKRVAPGFSGSRHYKKDGRLYTTVIEAVDILPSPSIQIGENDWCPQTVCGYPTFKSDCEYSPFPPQGSGQYALFQNNDGLPLVRIRCRLSRGYRHQVRAHLASVGLPIIGDPLYAPQGATAAYGAEAVQAEERIYGSLQLYAVSLEFPDPENPQRHICVALPPPDRMNP